MVNYYAIRSRVCVFLSHRSTPAETPLFFEFSLCLSRACLGKMMHFMYKWRKKWRFPYPCRSSSGRNEGSQCVGDSSCCHRRASARGKPRQLPPSDWAAALLVLVVVMRCRHPSRFRESLARDRRHGLVHSPLCLADQAGWLGRQRRQDHELHEVGKQVSVDRQLAVSAAGDEWQRTVSKQAGQHGDGQA